MIILKRFLHAVLICSIFAGYAPAENLVYQFGPESETAVVFTAAETGVDSVSPAVSALRHFAEQLTQTPPDVAVIIAITRNDSSVLPQTIPVKRWEGSRQLIQHLNTIKNPVVCVLDTGSSTAAELITGVKGTASPPWLLKSVHKTLTDEQIPVNFSPHTLIFHRIGWIRDDPVLRLYADESIPFIKIETALDISAVLSRLAENIHSNFTPEWDVHYLVQEIHNRLIIIQEKTLVRLILFTAMGILFFFMLFGFLFGKNNHRHIKDLLSLWWIAGYFLAVNYVSFFLSGHITGLLFLIRFGSAAAMNSFPVTAFTVKYTLTLLFIVLLTAVRLHLPLQRNTIICGFMANAVCLLNVFIFSAYNFSFSPVFLLIYFISFAASKCKHILLQGFFLLLLLLPLFLFASTLFPHSSMLFENLFFRNIEPSLIFLPFSLLLARLFLSIDTAQYQKRKQTIPIRIPAALVICLCLLTLIIPFHTETAHNKFTIMQKIEDGKTFFLKKHNTDNEKSTSLPYTAIKQAVPYTAPPESLLAVKTSLRNYYERSIGSITVNSSLKPESLVLILKAKNGTLFYEADKPFTLERNDAVFVSIPCPPLPFSVHFSGTKNALFDVTVSLWSTENPYGITPVQPEKTASHLPFLFEIEKSFQISAEPQP